jgi:hypothetical protein
MILSTGIGMAILGISSAVGHVVNWYAKEKDRAQQDKFVSLREEESRRAYSNMLAREEKQAQNAAELEEFRSTLRIQEAALGHERAKELARVTADIGQEMELAAERRARELANSPFKYSLEEVRERVIEHTGNGAAPVFLVAPFQYDYPAGRAPVFTTAIRETWRREPWSGDQRMLSGLITRPLEQSDVDLQTIRMALHDMPVVVVYGHVQANARLWISLTAWNLGDTTGTRVLDMSLAPIMLPAAREDTIQRRLEFEDGAAQAVSLIAGAYGDWFHILRSARMPRLHTLLPDELADFRRSLALSAASVYGTTVPRGLASEVRARLAQAVILDQAGLVEEAVATARPALAERPLDNGELADLIAVLRKLERSAAGPMLTREIDQMHLRILRIQNHTEELI